MMQRLELFTKSSVMNISLLSLLSHCFESVVSNCLVIGRDFYRQQTKLREGNVFTPVCDSVHGGGVYPSMHQRSHNALARHSPPGRHPLGQIPPTRMVNERAVRILLECILVSWYIDTQSLTPWSLCHWSVYYPPITTWFLFTCFRVRVQKLFLSSRPLLVRRSAVAYGGTQFSELIGHCR